MKQCIACDEVKPLSEYYRHSMMRDGHLGKCKECTKSYVRTHRAANIDRIREYDRARGKSPLRIANAVEVTRKWRAKDNRLSSAHRAVSEAISKGKMKRLPCERCANPKAVAHHDDYNKPLDVMWLCQPCHKQRHKELRSEGVVLYEAAE